MSPVHLLDPPTEKPKGHWKSAHPTGPKKAQGVISYLSQTHVQLVPANSTKPYVAPMEAVCQALLVASQVLLPSESSWGLQGVLEQF